MIQLGVALYPEQESIEEIENYLQLAQKYKVNFGFIAEK